MARQVLAELVRTYCDPSLNAAGFTRKLLVWNRWLVEDICHVVEVQLGKENDKTRTSFTLNFGVFVPTVYEICWNKNVEGIVHDVDCIVRLRAGQLGKEENLPQARDLWWIMDGQSTLPVVGREVSDVVAGKGIPFLDGMRSLNDVQRVLLTTSQHVNFPASRLYLAVVEARLGDSQGAIAILQEFSEPRLKTWSVRVAQIIKRLRL